VFRLGGGDLESLTSRRPLRGGVSDGDSRLAFRRGGVTDLVMDLLKLRPLSGSFPLLFRGGVRERDRLRSRARVRDGERDFEYDEPVYDE
jgi:hypothetical protein